MNAIEPIEATEGPRKGRPRRPPGPRKPPKAPAFRAVDVSRAVAGVRKAGLEPRQVSVDKDGKITLQLIPPDDSPGEKGERSEWSDLEKLAEK